MSEIAADTCAIPVVKRNPGNRLAGIVNLDNIMEMIQTYITHE